MSLTFPLLSLCPQDGTRFFILRISYYGIKNRKYMKIYFLNPESSGREIRTLDTTGMNRVL